MAGRLRPWCVYIIVANDGSLYTGVTTDVGRRFREHQGSGRGARYFSAGRRPLAVVYQEACADRASACRREAEIKQLSRAGKDALVLAYASTAVTDPG
jgi:putative endonuclease